MYDENDWEKYALYVLAAVVIGLVGVFLIYFSPQNARPAGYYALYFSSNDVNDASIVNSIDFSFTVENHYPSSRTIHYGVFVEGEEVDSGALFVANDSNATQSVTIPFEKNSFNQKKVFVRLFDTNQEIYFNAGLKVSAAFSNGFALVNAQISSMDVMADQPLRMNFSWVELAPTDRNYSVFVHFVDSKYDIAFQLDHSPPFTKAMLEGSSWKKDVLLSESVKGIVPANVPAGNYAILVGLYTPQGIIKTAGGGDSINLGTISVRAS